MSNVFFIGDLHLGHKNILSFSPERKGGDIEEHDQWIIDTWNSVVRSRDVVYVLGDVAFTREGLQKTKMLRGNKNLVMGNHDGFKITEYLDMFNVRPGILKYKGFWLSHAPIHPDELRGRMNIHGHVHSNTLPDSRYVNVSVEALNAVPLSLDEVRIL